MQNGVEAGNLQIAGIFSTPVSLAARDVLAQPLGNTAPMQEAGA